MDHRIRKIVVLGGGTAGWMTASYLGKWLGNTVSLTLIESPSVPRIGVGEATIPNLQPLFFDFLGLKEKDWMPQCNASFKIGIDFINWKTGGPGQAQARTVDGRRDSFYHVFAPLPEHQGVPMFQYWDYLRHHGLTEKSFDAACFWESSLLDSRKSPCWLDGRPSTAYAWHFDAHLVADFLRRFSTKEFGVRHVEDEMTGAEQDGRGYVTALRTASGNRYEADLFIDCSGFRGLLINKAMAEPFIDMNDYLLCDSAVATAVPHDDDARGVEPYTSAIAMESGWTWKIPMLGRFGTGYVFSSRFVERDRATRDLCRMWNLDPDRAELNQITFRVGRNRRAWVRNVVGVGLASCFLEPLESSGIYFITTALHHLVRHFPDKRFNETLISQYNREIEFMFEESRDFIQLHFLAAPRDDTEFWRANKNLRLSPQLEQKIAMYRAGLPVNQPIESGAGSYSDAMVNSRLCFPNSSYCCILAGSGVYPDAPLPSLAHQDDVVAASEPMFATVERKRRELAGTLPTTVEYLRAIHAK
ncbi:tryptophan halogenase family protein [Streptomyces sp. MP131-18]|uniref:tryptophan halogenase family protein n=1 Tax=Streptomyces sp. MP131-18 TaxID=1857892 RepID=UPI00097BAFD4|nr:tryptophan halogenase family protein [Streptomyces sp. MP131-18]ONK16174.1 Flavin-dependent tryptophan halogenase RebH [Streptomyces sp. MP131-18]